MKEFNILANLTSFLKLLMNLNLKTDMQNMSKSKISKRKLNNIIKIFLYNLEAKMSIKKLCPQMIS